MVVVGRLAEQNQGVRAEGREVVERRAKRPGTPPKIVPLALGAVVARGAGDGGRGAVTCGPCVDGGGLPGRAVTRIREGTGIEWYSIHC